MPARKKDQPDQPAEEQEDGTSPLVASIDPRQLAASQPGDGTEDDDIRREGDEEKPRGEKVFGEATSPLVASIDPDQLAVSMPGDGTETGETGDPRDGADTPSAVPEWGPDDVSNVVDPSDPMTLTGHDAQPGEAEKKK